jgi:hypothetical protein
MQTTYINDMYTQQAKFPRCQHDFILDPSVHSLQLSMLSLFTTHGH